MTKEYRHIHYRDIMQKYFTKFIKSEGGYPLRSLGVKTAAVKEALDTDLSSQLSGKRVDCLFRLEDDSLLHLEFQNNKQPNIVGRCWDYNYLISLHHRKEVNNIVQYPIIQTVVIFGVKVKRKDIDLSLKLGPSQSYSIEGIFLSELGEPEYLNHLLDEIKNNEKKDLTPEEISKIVFGTMSYQNVADINERVYNVANTLNTLDNEDVKVMLLTAILTLTKDVLNEETHKKVWRLLRMTDVIEEWEKNLVERIERETREKVERETREKVEQETREKVEQETREKVEQETREKAKREEAKKLEIVKKALKAKKNTDAEILEYFNITHEQLQELKKSL